MDAGREEPKDQPTERYFTVLEEAAFSDDLAINADPVAAALLGQHGPDSPERRMLRHLLYEAMQSYRGVACGVDAKGRRACRREAKKYFASTSLDPWSFEWVCDILGIEPSHWRRLLTGRYSAATRHAALSRVA